MSRSLTVPAFQLQDAPAIYAAAIPGRWLLKHATPSWRIKDPEKGFQRVVREDRARQIAINVLDQGRTFPNAVVLATNARTFQVSEGELRLHNDTRFLVVDGQHRLWAQTYSAFDAIYACVLHVGLTEVEMARLFLEINDNQRRVPSSLRWDLVRLVRPDDDPFAVKAVELVYELATDQASPLYQRVDLTGEQGEIELKQGSIAPEIKTIVSTKKGRMRELDFDGQYEALTRFLAALQSLDPAGWRSGSSPLAKARVLRALLRTLPDIATAKRKPANEISTSTYATLLSRIDTESLSADRIRAVQGSAGIKEIYELVKSRMQLD